MLELGTKLVARAKLIYRRAITPIVTGNCHWSRLAPVRLPGNPA
jgi:hypothetical protein